MKYKSVVAIRPGGPEMLQVVENELRPPVAGEALISILAVALVQDDIAVRRGVRPALPKFPFTPGYSMIGVVDAVGAGVANVQPGQRVAALINFGGYAEKLYWDARKLAAVPAGLDPGEAAALLLNYLVAYQILHRVIQARPGQSGLVVGASGGCGLAFLQLGRLAGLKLYGLASPGKHALVRAYGAVPIDYHDPDWVKIVRQSEPAGLDYVFNGMAQEYFEPGLSVLRRGGALVHYGGPRSMAGLARLIGKLLLYNLLPNGKRIKGYGTHRVPFVLIQEDWSKLFALLQAGQIEPVIARAFPILEARQANELFESGRFAGNIILFAPELFPGHRL